uniref:Uncharacterized protein n=1 Tax=Arundo donax TaxID=35708 RepID=A0A0A9AXN0_ARUDO
MSIWLVVMHVFRTNVIVVCFNSYRTDTIIDEENDTSIPVMSTQITQVCHVMCFLISKQ